MDKCLPLVEKSQAEILILLSDKNIDNEVPKNLNANNSKYYLIIKKNELFIIIYKFKVYEWCQKNYFELIMLNEIADEMDTTGIERVRQALYAHHWPNLKAKCKQLEL